MKKEFKLKFKQGDIVVWDNPFFGLRRGIVTDYYTALNRKAERYFLEPGIYDQFPSRWIDGKELKRYVKKKRK